MQRGLPEYARIGLLEILVGALSCAIFPTAHAEPQDPFESSATLAPVIAPQDLMWQSTMKGFAAISLTPAPLVKAAPADSGPHLTIPTKEAAAADQGGSSPSPFRRWISPRTTSTAEHGQAAEPRSSPSEERTPIHLSQPNRTVGKSLQADTASDHPEIAASNRNSRSRRSASGRKSAVSNILNPRESTPEESSSAIDAFEEAIAADATPLKKKSSTKTGFKADAEPVTPTKPRVELPQLSRNKRALRNVVRRVLRHHYLHPLNTRDRSPWEMIHASLSYELYSRVLQGGPDGRPVSAIGWVCFNQPCRNMKLMYINDEGELNPRVGPAFQGHRAQLLSILAQCNVSSDYPMLVDGHELKIRDLIVKEMKTCYPRSELTFKLIGLMHYLDSDTQWVNDQGTQWNMRKLLAEELTQPLRGAACGGTHRLTGITLAYKTREARGESVDGEYLKAKRFATQHQLYAYRLQNPDGSFSTNWFQGRENKNDIDRKLKTTGHILEWLLYSATDRELNSPRTARAVSFLANLMYANRYHDWEAGPLGHALHALLLYDKLKFAPYDEPSEVPLAIRDIVEADKKLSR